MVSFTKANGILSVPFQLFMAKENAGSEKNAAAESNATQGKKAARPLSPLLPVELTRDRPKLFAVKQNAGPEKNAAPESNAAPGKNAAMDGWSLARNSRGVTGSIPSNYVEKKDLSTSHETNGSSKETKTKKQIKQEWERKLDEEEERREEEAWKGLKLQAELCRRRDQLFDYKFGDKIGLDNFSGLNIDDVIQLRIGVFGPSGSGKSWFINTCERAIRETEKGTATEGNTGKEETVMLEDYLPEMFFHLTDTRGFFDYHSTELVAFENILNGKLQPSDIIYLQQSNPNRQKFHQSPTFGQRMHGVIFVLYANDPRLKDGAMKDHLEPFRGVLRKNGIVPVTVVSLMDRLHSIEDYRENLLNASEATGSSLSHTFWMPTYPTRNTPCNLAIVRSSFDILDIVLASAENMVKFWKLKEVAVTPRALQVGNRRASSAAIEGLDDETEEVEAMLVAVNAATFRMSLFRFVDGFEGLLSYGTRREKKQTECVEPSGYKTAKDGRLQLMFFCNCSSCGMTKTKFVKKNAHNGGFLDVGNSHSIGEMHFKGLTKRLVNLRRIGAAKAVKSDFAKKKIKVLFSPYVSQRTYAEVVSGAENTPDDNQTWMTAYQQESEEDTLKKAIQLSKNDSISDSSDEDWSIVQTPGFGNKGNCGQNGSGSSGYIPVIDLTENPSPAKKKQTRESSTDSDTTDIEENLDNVLKQVKQRKFDPAMWESAPISEVEKLPLGIDGLVKYAIVKARTSKEISAALPADGRKWKKSKGTQWKQYGELRYADCRGSFKCINTQCPFRIQFGVANTNQFKNVSSGQEACSICGDSGEFVICRARRYVFYGKKIIQVFHCGSHTCPIAWPEKLIKPVMEMLKKHPHLKPAEIQSAFVMSSLQTEENWKKVEKEATHLLDRKWIANQKQSVCQEIHPSGQTFEALVTFKQYCDKKDSVLIYKVNDRRTIPDRPSFVFKTSEEKMKAALNMDRNGEHVLKEEFCFVDGKVKRELLEDCAVLVSFNEGLQKVTGDNKMVFHPQGWCTDMAGANMNGLRQVFGDDAMSRIKSCEFHFKKSVNKMARRLGQEAGETFKKLCQSLLICNLKETYLEAKKSLEEFINEKSERQFLSSWLSWWDNRRTFIFGAFAPTNAPRMNQAEVIHAGGAHKDPSNPSLLDAAHTDTRDSVLFAVEPQSIEKGTSKGGTGSSYEQQKTKFHRRELERANQLGEEMMRLASKNGLLVDPNSGHRPPENKTTRKRKQHKRTEVESPNVE
ncbi:hypothetical protein AWC38_SpisGene16499 [Stylophora pistillata]|uniref:Uncharacterized protein n=1 Tax=Stylophora pistillata TaxID=50429 RepID=A0A2B4RS83_STYPI|nr:hypothetical protein AWC38_SpisGene16499 [Stylophora pistillata]